MSLATRSKGCLIAVGCTAGQSEDVCNLPTEVGPCNEAILRYTYNRSIGRCEAFYYSGCQGNANNFDSLEQCQQRCESLGQQGLLLHHGCSISVVEMVWSL